ncbi:conserved hypothetical protein [metagenome]|uniref:Bacterial spore germination immunoglobulin-like domain-containing protein n=1 Tax=metagenome TaxID=256318 RepID=A0A2P2BWX0_9ZZZZ
MTSQLPDEERLRRLLDETVADLDPADRLDAIRARTRRSTRSDSDTIKRPWFWGTLGAAVATAAVVGGFALLNDERPTADPAPITTPSDTATDPQVTPSQDPTSAGGETVVAGVYYTGDTPRGPRLFREFHQVPAADRLLASLEQATAQPSDPDYRSDWPAGSFTSAGFDGVGTDGVYSITLADASLRDRPAGMTADEAGIAVEALIYTIQAAGQTRAPVQFYLDSNPIDQVYGVPTAEPLAQGDPLEVLSLVNLSNPAEGATVSGRLQVDGVASSYEATVPWQLLDGSTEVAQGFFTAGGYVDRLYPFADDIDLTGVAPGTYTLRVQTDDPSGGEGPGPFVDTRTVTVE